MRVAEAATTEDEFLGGKVKIRQLSKGYRAGIDAVLLAAAAPVAVGRAERVLDAGSGVGTVGLCLAARVSDAQVLLVERDPVFARLARDNIALNGFAERVSVSIADVCAKAADQEAAGLSAESVDHALANPPYHDSTAGTLAHDRKADANAMPDGALDRWARFLARMTRQGGTVTVIHKAEAITDLLVALAPRFGALKVLPICPRPGEPAIRILVQGIRGSRAPLTLLAPFVLHCAEGHAFTPEAAAILRAGAPLAFKS